MQERINMYKCLVEELNYGTTTEMQAADAIEKLEKKAAKQRKEIVRMTQKVNMLLKDHDNQKNQITILREEYHAAVSDIYLIAENKDPCMICEHRAFCSNDGMCNFSWRRVKSE